MRANKTGNRVRYSGEAGLVNCRLDGQDQVPC